MRFGTLLLFLILIIMGFGFLLSNNMFLGQDLKAAQQHIAEITQGKILAENQLDQLRAEFANLKQQYELLAQEKRALQAQYSFIQEQNAQMQAQMDRMNRLNALVNHLTKVSPNALILALILPLLPITLAGSILVYRNGKSGHQPSGRKAGTSGQKFSIDVTKEEMKLIREMRRNGKGTSV